MRPTRLATVRARLSGTALTLAFRRLDAAGLALAAMLSALLGRGEPVLQQSLGAVLPLVIGALVAHSATRAVDGYRFSAREPLVLELIRAVAAGFIGAGAAAGVGLIDWAAATDSLRLWAVLAPVTLCVTHTLAWMRVRGWRRNGRLTPNLFIVGATAERRD